MRRSVGPLTLLLAVAACRSPRAGAPAAPAASTWHDDRIFDFPAELCEDGSDGARPLAEPTCRGRPIGSALRRYRRGDASLEAGFVPHVSRAVVGEPVCVTFVLRNAGPRPVRLDPVGYRTRRMERNSRFVITAVGPGGAPVRDPEDGGELDTIGEAFVTLPSGATYVDDLVLPEWLVLETPGTYTITATRKGVPWEDTETRDEIRSTFDLQALPADPRRVAGSIDRLAGDLRAPRRGRGRTFSRALHALISIRDAAAAPHVAGALRDSSVFLSPLPLFDTPGGRRVAIEALAGSGPERSYPAALLGTMPRAEESVQARRRIGRV